MSQIDLKEIRLGDLVEYQRPERLRRTWGTFQGWFSSHDGQVYLIVRSLALGIDLFVDPRQVTAISRQRKGQP